MARPERTRRGRDTTGSARRLRSTGPAGARPRAGGSAMAQAASEAGRSAAASGDGRPRARRSGPGPAAVRPTSSRASALMTNESTNRITARAIRAESWRLLASPNSRAMTLGERRAGAEQGAEDVGGVAEQEGDGDRLAHGAARGRAPRRRRCPSGTRGASRCAPSPSAWRRARRPPPAARGAR